MGEGKKRIEREKGDDYEKGRDKAMRKKDRKDPPSVVRKKGGRKKGEEEEGGENSISTRLQAHKRPWLQRRERKRKGEAHRRMVRREFIKK